MLALGFLLFAFVDGARQAWLERGRVSVAVSYVHSAQPDAGKQSRETLRETRSSTSFSDCAVDSWVPLSKRHRRSLGMKVKIEIKLYPIRSHSVFPSRYCLYILAPLLSPPGCVLVATHPWFLDVS